MEYIELLGVDTQLPNSKLIRILSSVPNTYSINDIKILIEELHNRKKNRFEFDLTVDKARDFAYDLIEYGFLIGESSIHEEEMSKES